MDIFSVSPHLIVNQPYNGFTYSNAEPPNRAGAGDVFYSTTSNTFQVYDGTSWNQLNQDFSVDMTNESAEAIEWAIDKMKKERELEKLAKDNAAVKNALDAYKKAEEQLKIIATIAETPETNG